MSEKIVQLNEEVIKGQIVNANIKVSHLVEKRS